MGNIYYQMRLSNISDSNKYMIFLGDSFTWGQGLYLLNWLDRKPEVLSEIINNHINEDEISVNWKEQEQYIDDIDIEIKDRLSFTNIVADKLDRKCLKKIDNGGAIWSNIITLNQILENGKIHKDMIIIFQFSSVGREEFDSITEEEFKLYNSQNLDIRNILTSRIKKIFDKVNDKLSAIESKYGYKYLYLDWFGDFYDFAPDKFIKIGKNKCFNQLILNNYVKLTYKDKIICDGHLNEDANKNLAEHILNKINLEKW